MSGTAFFDYVIRGHLDISAHFVTMDAPKTPESSIFDEGQSMKRLIMMTGLSYIFASGVSFSLYVITAFLARKYIAPRNVIDCSKCTKRRLVSYISCDSSFALFCLRVGFVFNHSRRSVFFHYAIFNRMSLRYLAQREWGTEERKKRAKRKGPTRRILATHRARENRMR